MVENKNSLNKMEKYVQNFGFGVKIVSQNIPKPG
jgi:hypothetical protein